MTFVIDNDKKKLKNYYHIINKARVVLTLLYGLQRYINILREKLTKTQRHSYHIKTPIKFLSFSRNILTEL